MKTYLTSKPELEMSLEEALALQVKLSEAIQKVVTSRLANPSQVISMPTILTENKGHNAAGVVVISITRRPEAAHALILNQLDEITRVNRNTFVSLFSDSSLEVALISDGSVSITVGTNGIGEQTIKIKKIDFKDLLVFLKENPIAKSVLTD